MKNTTTIFLILISIFTFSQESELYKFQSENGKFGFMDKTGKIKIKPEYLNVGEFSDGLCFVSKEVIKKGYKWIFIDTLGKKVFDIEDNFPETPFNEGFARISNFEEQWFVNKKGINEFGKTWKDGEGEFKNGIAFVSDKEFSDFYPINLKGERIESKTFNRIDIYNLSKDEIDETLNNTDYKSNKFVPFQQNKLWGFKDSSNNIIIKPQFNAVDKFANGVCAVRINKLEYEIINDYFLDAIIDENGKVLNKIAMHCYMGFQRELIEFYGGPHFSGGIYYLNQKGEKIIPTE